MWFSSWLRSDSTRRVHAHQSARNRPTFRPQLEALEDRWVPSTLTVLNNLDSGAGSLRADVAAAKSGDTIDLSNLAGQTISLTSGELVINKSLTINGPNASQSPVTISGYSCRVFEVDGARTNAVLSNLNITAGDGEARNASSAGAVDGQGGAVWNGGTLTIDNCTLANNSDYRGNVMVELGGAIYNAGTLTLNNSALDNNSVGITSFDLTVGGDGGAIYNAGTLTLSNCTLSGNTAYEGGGGTGAGFGGGIFNAYKASATVTGSTLSGNNAKHDGGGIYNDGTLLLSGSSLSGNVANDGPGGGIFNDNKGHLTIQSSSVVNDYSFDLYNLGAVNVSKDSVIGVTYK